MNTATEDKLEIRTSSQELFQDVINSVPLLPEKAELTFLAEGIVLPQYHYSRVIHNKEENDEKRYISECSKKGIIPLSMMELRYSHNRGRFMPEHFSGIIRVPGTESSNYIIENAIIGLIKGGKIHQIDIKIDEGAHRFEEFKKSLFNNLLEQKYQIYRGTMYVIEDEFRIKGVRLYFLAKIDNRKFKVNKLELQLQIGEEVHKRETNKMTNWFNQLKEKYQSHQLSFL